MQSFKPIKIYRSNKHTFIITCFVLILLYGSGFGQEFPMFNKTHLKVIDTTYGDLDYDGKPELVVVCEEPQAAQQETAAKRILQIYKLKDENWILWKSSLHVLYAADAGGMMGDPLEKIQIKDSGLIIRHTGGSSWKWGHNDKYKFISNSFRLIEYTGFYGKPCEYWINIHFNLSTGEVQIEKEEENCNTNEKYTGKITTEIFYHKGIFMDFNNRSEKEIILESPVHKISYIIAKPQ